MMTTVAGGGTSPFVLADAAFAVVERRTVPGEASADGLAEVEAILSAMRGGDPSVQAEASLLLSREAWEFDPGSAAGTALSGMLAEALGARLGRVPRPVGAPYWMESALWQAAGVPTVVCGPAGGGMHAEDEWVDLAQVRAYADALVDTIRAFCGPPANAA
jgi:acetylornithine deacetylase